MTTGRIFLWLLCSLSVYSLDLHLVFYGKKLFIFWSWFSGNQRYFCGKGCMLCIVWPLTPKLSPSIPFQHSLFGQQNEHHSKPYPSSVEQKVAHYPGPQWSLARGGPTLPRWWVFPLVWPSRACGEKANRAALHSCFQKARKSLVLALNSSSFCFLPTPTSPGFPGGRGGVLVPNHCVLKWSFLSILDKVK